MSKKDIRIFYSNRAKSWIIANDFKLRRLMSEGYSYRQAKHLSHGHLNNKELCELMKENILANKRTKSREIWILGCYARVTDKTYRHFNWVCGLYKTKKNKSEQSYYNSNKGVRT
ncbi:MAG TPA: hypothetical protein VFC79_03335 [Tissierellaceae bacterium]|nr:hypothetical protein [Tissierellaceae bacterium]